MRDSENNFIGYFTKNVNIAVLFVLSKFCAQRL